MLQLMKPSHEIMPVPRDEARWDAVQRRDCAADGAFVYSVPVSYTHLTLPTNREV